MPDPKQIPHLIKLLDDESEMVLEAVLKELAAFGPTLREELAKLPEPLSNEQQEKIQTLLADHNRHWLKENWKKQLSTLSDNERLEKALSLLAEFQNGPGYPVQLKTLLNTLAEEYRQAHQTQDAVSLANFLFKAQQLQGNTTDYYNPANSNLVYVIEHKRGIPISLACIYILTGVRLGLEIEGCNFPGHFLAKITVEGKTKWVDCFNGGRLLDEAAILEMTNEPPQSIRDILEMNVNAETIIARMLTNLIRAYELLDQQTNRQLMIDLLEILEASL